MEAGQWSRGARKPTCRGPTICPGPRRASTLHDIEGGAGGALPPSQANRVVRPNPGSCRQQLCSDLGFSLQRTMATVPSMYVLLGLLAGTFLTHPRHHLTRDTSRFRTGPSVSEKHLSASLITRFHLAIPSFRSVSIKEPLLFL